MQELLSGLSIVFAIVNDPSYLLEVVSVSLNVMAAKGAAMQTIWMLPKIHPEPPENEINLTDDQVDLYLAQEIAHLRRRRFNIFQNNRPPPPRQQTEQSRDFSNNLPAF